MLKKNPLYQSGQVAVVVLLIMVVLLTIGLSLATRTTQELFLSDQQADSARVFNAAESGLEEALSSLSESGTLTIDGVDVEFNVQGSSRLETRIAEGASLHLNLSGYNNDVTFSWASEADCSNRASLVAHIFYDDSGTTRSIAIPFGCDHSDNFESAGSLAGNPYYNTYTIDIDSVINTAAATPLFMRVRPVYADTDILVEGNIGFPTQYHIISSSATYAEGDEERNIEVSRTLPAGPAYMDYALYSGGAITQP